MALVECDLIMNFSLNLKYLWTKNTLNHLNENNQISCTTSETIFEWYKLQRYF